MVTIYDKINITSGICLEFDENFQVEASQSGDNCPCNCGYKVTFIGEFANALFMRELSNADAVKANYGGVGLNLSTVTWTSTLPSSSAYQSGRNYMLQLNGVTLQPNEYAITSDILEFTSTDTSVSEGDVLTLITI